MFSEPISTSSATGLRTRRGPPGRASCTGTRSRIFSATRCGPGPAWPTPSRSGPWPGAWWRSGQTSPKLGEDDGALATTWVLHQKQMKCFQISRRIYDQLARCFRSLLTAPIFHFSDPNKNEDGLWLAATSGTSWPAYSASNREFLWISANNYSIGSGMRSINE